MILFSQASYWLDLKTKQDFAYKIWNKNVSIDLQLLTFEVPQDFVRCFWPFCQLVNKGGTESLERCNCTSWWPSTARCTCQVTSQPSDDKVCISYIWGQYLNVKILHTPYQSAACNKIIVSWEILFDESWEEINFTICINPDSKIHGANMGPIWVLSAPCWPHEPCYQGTDIWWQQLVASLTICLPIPI